jgi:hypothetical protein
VQQPLERRLDTALGLPSCQVQNAQVLFYGPQRLLLGQRVVGQPEMARRKQVGLIAVVRERSRLPHQPVDHVPIVDPMLAAATQPRQPFHTLLRVPHLQFFHADPHLHPLADQPARYRIDIALDVERAAAIHTQRPPFARLQTTGRQRS